MEGKGFVAAGGLAVGNAIVTRAGPSLVVKALTWHRRPEGYKVYNFVVEGDHTYFVGKAEGGAWVHNPRVCLPNYKALPGDAEAAETEMRDQLEKEGAGLTPKDRVNAGGADATWDGKDDYPGWDYAEIKPNSRRMRTEVFKQIRDRYANGYTGTIRAYGYHRDANGKMIVTLLRIYTDANTWTVP